MDQRYDHRICEARMQELWHTHDIYHNKSDDRRPVFSIDTPPPTVSGTLHIGHIFSYTQTDIIARYKRLNGYKVFYPFGFDDNGLPTERYVEKKHGVSSYMMGRAAFIQLCLEETQKVEKDFIALWQKMGLSAQWSHPYSTISDKVRALSQASFIELFKKGYIYRANEPAPYCTVCHTSVAQAELDDHEKTTLFNTIAFSDAKGNDLLISTTRPEFLPACVALFYHPDDERYHYLKDTQARVPIFNFEVPIYADARVVPDKGTGLVMCCTFGDSTDIEWFKAFNLPYKAVLNQDGKFNARAGILEGLKVKAAREKIIQTLQEEGLLIMQREVQSVANVHERCKTEVEYIALSQWFIKLMDHKEIFIALGDRIHWYPSFMKARYLDWATNIKWDWCISRQRFFGIPFPVWHCAHCNHIILASLDELPVDPQQTRYKEEKCPECGSENLSPDTDVMDTWNTSSLTPYICAQLYAQDDGKEYFINSQPPALIPMSMRPQAHDIIRTWAFDTIVKVWLHHQTLPWNDIVISGHVLSEGKEKLSKSKGQKAASPQDLLAQYPADAIRYWTATSTLGQDVAFSDTQLTIGIRLLTKLWNAFRFIKEHALYAPEHEPIVGTVNEWVLHEGAHAFEHYHRAFEKYEFSNALETINKFFWSIMCDNYLELIKHSLFNPVLYDESLIRSTKATLWHVGKRILQMYAPFIPHITEQLYQELYVSHCAERSLHTTQFSLWQTRDDFPESVRMMNIINEMLGRMRKAKTAHQLSLKTPIVLTLHASSENEHILRSHEQLLKAMSNASAIEYKNLDHDTSEYTMAQVGDEWHCTIRVES